nr:Unknown Function [uncultured bacterium]
MPNVHAAGGGCPSIRGSPLSKHAQLGALAVHIVNAGRARLGSSNVPTRTNIKCGLASASLKSGVPHAPQNRRRMRFPLSETLKYSLASPVLEKVDVRKHEFTVPLPAPRYWQSRHQHTRVTIGNSELVQRTNPQRHLPVIVM